MSWLHSQFRTHNFLPKLPDCRSGISPIISLPSTTLIRPCPPPLPTISRSDPLPHPSPASLSHQDLLHVYNRMAEQYAKLSRQSSMDKDKIVALQLALDSQTPPKLPSALPVSLLPPPNLSDLDGSADLTTQQQRERAKNWRRASIRMDMEIPHIDEVSEGSLKDVSVSGITDTANLEEVGIGRTERSDSSRTTATAAKRQRIFSIYIQLTHECYLPLVASLLSSPRSSSP